LASGLGLRSVAHYSGLEIKEWWRCLNKSGRMLIVRLRKDSLQMSICPNALKSLT
jgi:hypothetical protein